MNIEEYMNSGIVESYVLGFASKAEEMEFEKMCLQYPQLVAARTQFELELQYEMMQGALKPPENLKAKILASLAEGTENGTASEAKSKAASTPAINWWKWVAAASCIALIGTLVFAISANSKYAELKNDLASIRRQQNGLAGADPILAIKPVAEKPSVKWTALLDKSNPAHCMAHLYWDSTTNETYLLVGNISEAQRNAQFHLVAVMENKLNDLGTFDMASEGVILKMKKIARPTAFMITVQSKSNPAKPSRETVVAEGQL